jgi:hypothetical protein
LKLFKNIFREMEAFDYKCEAFIKITRLYEDIFNGTEAFLNRFRAFSKNPRLLKLFTKI